MSDSNPAKRKRPTGSKKSTNSFVSNVTSRVSGLLPSRLSKWLSNRSERMCVNGSATVSESTDSSTEDEATEDIISSQPSAKRMRYTSPTRNANTHYKPISTRTSSTNTEAIEPFNTASTSSDRMFRRNTRFVSSSNAQQNDESVLSPDDSHMNNFDLYSTSEVPLERKRKSIFDKTQDSDAIIEDAVARSASAKSVNISQPYFKAGLLCSPFYSGRTSYGGASSSFVNQPNINQRKKTVVKEIKNNDNDVTMSHSARRIIDLLENITSPLSEARRIPPHVIDNSFNSRITPYKSQELRVPQIASIIRLKHKQLMDTTNTARQIIASSSSSSPYPQNLNSQSQSAPEKEQFTTKIKSRLTRKNRDPVENSMALPSVTLPTISLQIEPDNLPNFSFNTNSIITSSPCPPISTIATPKLPETQSSSTNEVINVTLEIPNQKTTLREEPCNPTELNSIGQFKFSSPIAVSIEQPISSTATFSFGSPERNLDSAEIPTALTFSQTESQPMAVDSVIENSKEINVNMENNTSKECSCNSEFGNKFKCSVCEKGPKSIEESPILNASASGKWKCSDCWVENDSISVACVCCGAKKSGGTSYQSKSTESSKACKWKCNDCLIDNDSSTCVSCGANKNGVKSTPAQTDKWKCKDCWVQNDGSASQCVCCGCAKHTTNTSENHKTNSLVTISKQKSNDSGWKCDVCLIKNLSTADKCAACTNPKPGSSSTNLPPQNITQSDKWECSICLVRNENNRIKCVCCEAEKPGAKKQPESNFSFKDNPGALFKFGIPPGAKQDTNVQVPSLVTATSAKETEANNNVLPKTTFTFGIPKSNQETSKPAEDRKKDEPTKATFTFGIYKPAATSRPPGEAPEPLLDSPKTPNVTEPAPKVLDKPAEIPKAQPESSVFITSTPSVADSVASNLLSPPVAALNESNTSTQSVPILNTPATTINAPISNVLSTTLSAVAVTSAESNSPTNTFSFSAGTLQPNLFASPISQVTTTNSSFPSVTAVTTGISLFSKTDPANAAPISLFQKSDSASISLPVFGSNTTTVAPTAAQPPTTSAAPLFCFSNSTNNPAPTNEKPKFNFRFGNNNGNNETPSMFKSFGATSESNKFTLPTSNTLGLNSLTGNTLGGSGLSTSSSSNNAISGINGLPTGNTILGGDIGSNQANTGNNLPSGSTSSTPATGLFGNPVPKVNNMWSANNAASVPTQFEKPAATFTFGSSTAFSTSSTFGAPQQSQQPSPNLFGISNPTTRNSQPALFTSTIQNPPQSNVFGNTAASNSVPMFGAPNIASAPTFGTSALPTFEAPTATPTPSFNFGSNATRGVFGFSQQQQPQQQTAGVYNFGGGSAPQVQFNMGSAPNPTVRRVRKAIRRTQR